MVTFDSGSTLIGGALASSLWLLAAYCAYLLTVALAQGRLVFSSAKGVRPPGAELATHFVEPTVISVGKRTAINGWLLLPRVGEGPFPAILYFGGRSEEVSWLQDAAKWFPGHVVLAMNYRGYGESGGRPSERALYSDALRQFEFLARSGKVDARRVTVIGRSLGTGVAAFVAANRPAENVVLITPYDSILSLARELFRLLPIGFILLHKFESIRFARSARQPCLSLLAEHDDIVSEPHARRLVNAWGGNVDVLRIPGSDHRDIPYRADTLDVIAGWLAGHPAWAALPQTPAVPFASDRR